MEASGCILVTKLSPSRRGLKWFVQPSNYQLCGCYEVVPFAKGTEMRVNHLLFEHQRVTKLSPSRRGLKWSTTYWRPKPCFRYEVVPFAKGTEIPVDNLVGAEPGQVTKLSPSRRGLKLRVCSITWTEKKLRSCPLREGD